jgi:hypothetical protein
MGDVVEELTTDHVMGDVVSHVDLLILRDRGTEERIVKRKK